MSPIILPYCPLSKLFIPLYFIGSSSVTAKQSYCAFSSLKTLILWLTLLLIDIIDVVKDFKVLKLKKMAFFSPQNCPVNRFTTKKKEKTSQEVQPQQLHWWSCRWQRILGAWTPGPTSEDHKSPLSFLLFSARQTCRLLLDIRSKFQSLPLMHFSPAKRRFGVSEEFERLRSENQAVAHFHHVTK